jgi:hypothetical protein
MFGQVPWLRIALTGLAVTVWTLAMPAGPARAGGSPPGPATIPSPGPTAVPDRSGHPYSGTRWEYRVETLWAGSVDGLAGAVANLVLSSNDTERLKEWGDAGWELVAIQGNRIYLKRPVLAAPTPPPHSWWWPF